MDLSTISVDELVVELGKREGVNVVQTGDADEAVTLYMIHAPSITIILNGIDKASITMLKASVEGGVQ